MSFRPSRLSDSTFAKRVYHAVRRRNRILRDLDAYVPYSSGGLRQLADLTVEAVNGTPPLLDELSSAAGATRAATMTTTEFWIHLNSPAVASLQRRFDHFGSDKAGRHDYHYVYSAICADIGEPLALLEIGLGTNNTDVPSNMGKSGRPGASLRAFRDEFPSCQVYGADVDRRILFAEERIETFFVDQRETSTVRALADRLPTLDLVIDDGLHSPSANLAVLNMALGKVRPGGWIVIEDIRPSIRPLWQAVAGLLSRHHCYLVESRSATMFCVRLSDESTA